MVKRIAPLALAALLISAHPASGYSVLTHEAIIDSAWDSDIRPLLVGRFHANAATLEEARAFAYGGCILQDIGYYPLSSRLFGDLAHYVRSGDFVGALVRDARSADELAFALGALAHYTADTYGHPIAINRAVPLMFPKLERKFGDVVTYEDNRSAHLRTEFAFDVLEVARGRYLPDSYRHFIGFQVSTPLVERAFRETYGLELRDVFGDLDLAVGTFRWAIGSLMPKLTQTAWASKQDDIERLDPTLTRDRFVFTYTKSDFEQAFGTSYRRPGLFARFVAWTIKILPKIGPLKVLAFKVPTPEAERLFLESFDTVVREYHARLAEVARGSLTLADRNLDTGRLVREGDYQLVDQTYAALVDRLDKDHFAHVTPALRTTILTFYGSRTGVRTATASDGHEWKKLNAALAELRRAPEPRGVRASPRR